MNRFILLALLFLSIDSFAQNVCLDGSTTTGTLYTQRNSVFNFLYTKNRGGFLTSAPACPRVRLITRTGIGTCQFAALGQTYDEWTYEILNPPVQCDLDHYAYGAVLVAGVFVFRRMRR